MVLFRRPRPAAALALAATFVAAAVAVGLPGRHGDPLGVALAVRFGLCLAVALGAAVAALVSGSRLPLWLTAAALAGGALVLHADLRQTVSAYGCSVEAPRVCFDRDERVPAPAAAVVGATAPAVASVAVAALALPEGRRRRLATIVA